VSEKGLYLLGYELGHPTSCPGCGGTGVEDVSRWGGDFALCTWNVRDNTLHERCACRRHIMNAVRRLGVPVVELDAQGEKHGFERCPPWEPAPALGPPPLMGCARGVRHQGPCAPPPGSDVGRQVRQFVGIALLTLGSFTLGFWTAWQLLR
jgi:hypothetical protein